MAFSKNRGRSKSGIISRTAKASPRFIVHFVHIPGEQVIVELDRGGKAGQPAPSAPGAAFHRRLRKKSR